MVHCGPFWPIEVQFGPFRSANRTLATPEYCDANGRRAPIQMAGVLTIFPFAQGSATPIALQCRLEMQCNANWRGVPQYFFEKSEEVVVGPLHE